MSYSSDGSTAVDKSSVHGANAVQQYQSM
jgi:hypothetical protein